MPSPLELAIREHLRRYVTGEITLQEFDLWFIRATADVDRDGTQAELDLTYEIFLRLAEYDHGDWTLEELKRRFRSLAEHGLPTSVAS